MDLLTAHAARTRRHLWRLLEQPDQVDGLTPAAREACRRFAGQLAGWRARLDRGEFDDLVATIMEESNYRDELDGLYKDALESAARWNQAMEVGDSLNIFAKADQGRAPAAILTDYLTETMLSGRSEDRRKGGGEAVKIITVHSAKGLEFPCVYLAGLDEEFFPHKKSIEDFGVEEERRLFYVALTRARRELVLTRCRSRTTRGRERKLEPSRFLAEIPEECLMREDTPTREEEALDWLRSIKSRLGGA